MSKLNLDYFHGSKAEQFSFYRLPKILFTDDRFLPKQILRYRPSVYIKIAYLKSAHQNRCRLYVIIHFKGFSEKRRISLIGFIKIRIGFDKICLIKRIGSIFVESFIQNSPLFQNPIQYFMKNISQRQGAQWGYLSKTTVKLNRLNKREYLNNDL